jgi:uncharacterized damage-inducible protein DinB
MNPEHAKVLADFFANLLEQESSTTAKVIAAVPDDKRDYKPDAKSRSAWELATHLAVSDVWFIDSVLKGTFTFDPSAEQAAVGSFKTVQDVVDFYKREFPAKLRELRGLPVEKLTEVVDFFGVMQQPNANYLGIANNHSIHHRGQLAAYLRAMGSKVPSIYGGSADEPMTGS